MSRNFLYFPYIKVPNSAWFSRILLYSDKVGAIVPFDYIEDPDKLGEYMVELVKEELVEQVIPGAHLWQVENFSSTFLKYVDDKYGEKNKPASGLSARFENMGYSTIHGEKLDQLVEGLCERDLVIRKDPASKYSPWVEVKTIIASDFMAYLAGVLGQLPGEKIFLPITEKSENLDIFMDRSIGDDGLRAQLRNIVLEGVLPAPSTVVAPGRLRDFKDRYSTELNRLNAFVESKISELATNPDPALRTIRLEDIKGEFRESIDEVSARIAEADGWPRIGFTTLCAVTGAGLVATQAVMDENDIMGLAGAALTIAPVIYDAFRDSPDPYQNRPLAYAAFAEMEFRERNT